MTLKTKTVSSLYEDWPDGLPGRRQFKPYSECFQCNGDIPAGARFGFILWEHVRTFNTEHAGKPTPVYNGPSRPVNVVWFCSEEHREQWVKDRGDKAKVTIAYNEET